MTAPVEMNVGVKPGDILAGKYRVERVLGVGGMGVVVAAHHLQLDERVALKFLLPEALSNAEAVARFAREARAAVKIKSEHVARVTDVGTLPSGAPYMVMEYLEGRDLSTWLEQRGALPIDQAVEFILQACVAVADAHVLGIVHRDLKPANLFCVRRSDGQLTIKVLDFGISKITRPSGSAPSMSVTKTSTLMGSPLYMSPEQMQSAKGVDARTDIWALGVVLFELTAGRPPFQGESVTELAIKIAVEAAPPLRTLRPDVAPGLDAVVLKCLEKNPSRRYSNVGELALALLPFASRRAQAIVERISGIIEGSGLSASAPDLPPSHPVGSTPVSPGTLPPFGRTTTGTPRGKRAALGAGVLGVVAVVTVAGFLIVSKRAPARHEDPVPATSQAGPVAAASQEVRPADLPAPTATESADTATTARTMQSAAVVPATPNAATSTKRTRPPPGGPAPAATAVASPSADPSKRPATAVNCDPPFSYDAKGNKVFKKECL